MKKIIATVGPSLLNKYDIGKIYSKDLIFRINGAHGDVEEIKSYVKKIRAQEVNAEILMDLPGNKVRTSNIEKPIKLQFGKTFELNFKQTNFEHFYKHITVGDKVWANDSTYEFAVEKIDKKNKKITFLSKSDGFLINNKGMHVRGIHDNIPFLFKKDVELIELANSMELQFVGLSFVRNLADIKIAKNLISKNVKIITKVETKAAIENLKEILNNTNYILIDRGDLSTEVGLENIPSNQKHILKESRVNGVKTFLATQFLKNMENNPVPSIPEVMDLYNTISEGVYGIQLSEETAVGTHPYNCIQLVRTMMKKL